MIFKTDLQEALHFASLLSSHGYLFPIEDHVLVVKNDSTSLYRFQVTMVMSNIALDLVLEGIHIKAPALAYVWKIATVTNMTELPVLHTLFG